ncbi:MAG: universal stress protein [Desulfobacterales bacterium]|nr:universal stress protein [Desulfobacterales bacterium]MBS3756428.1 universal stress protein [Desulfobacterales bacterium]
MKILVGYNQTAAAKAALSLAGDHALCFNAKVYIMTSMEGGTSETLEEIEKVEKKLQEAGQLLQEKGVEFETHQLARGMAPGEDLVRFAEEKEIDLVFVGIKKKSRAQKIILGSTAQYIILRAPCPVTTVK